MAVSKRTRFEVLRRDNYTCRYCRSSENPLVVDHVTPVALGGTDNPKNLVAACRDCNSGKSSAAPDSETLDALTDVQIAYEKARVAIVAREEKKARGRRKVYQQFLEEWDATAPRYAELPNGWRATVSMWLARGMPMERIIDAVHIASSKGHLPSSAVYPYMAKIVWNWISDLEDEIAQEAAKSQPQDEVDPIANEDEAWWSAYEHVHELYMGEIVGGAILRHHIDGSSNRVPAAYRHEKESAA